MKSGLDPLHGRISNSGGYRNNFGAIIFPQSKSHTELKENKASYAKMSKELEEKLARVDELIGKLEKE